MSLTLTDVSLRDRQTSASLTLTGVSLRHGSRLPGLLVESRAAAVAALTTRVVFTHTAQLLHIRTGLVSQWQVSICAGK